MKGLAHGQIWWADLDVVRPVLILTRSTVAPRLHRVLVAPITSVVRDIPTELPLGREEGVADDSVASFDNVQLLPVSVLLGRAGQVSMLRWPEASDAMRHTMGCHLG